MAEKPEIVTGELITGELVTTPWKPGWQTTEFLLTALFFVGVVVLIGLGRMEVSDVVDLWPLAGAITGYSGVRGLAKMRAQ